MDSKCNFIEAFKEFIISCDEIFLIDAANKGLYKRALKEIDKGITAQIDFEEDKVIYKLSDGTECELTDDIVKYKCSCPSRSICKHILICILYTQKNMSSIFGGEVLQEDINEENTDNTEVNEDNTEKNMENSEPSVQEENTKNIEKGNAAAEEEKNHSNNVVHNSTFINSFKDFISSCDEIFLIDSANKGLYKRALKEIDKGITAQIDFEEDKVSYKLSDGTECELTDHLVKLKCSCPSRSICKHILICILYTQMNMSNIFGKEGLQEKNNDVNIDNNEVNKDNCEKNSENSEADEQEVNAKDIENSNAAGQENKNHIKNASGNKSEINKIKGDFSWLLDYPVQNITKEISDKVFKDIIFRLNFGRDVEIEEEKFLVVNFKDTDIRVRFTEKPSIEKSICTCKEKEFCVHRAEAIIYYKLHKKVLDIEKLCESINIKFSKEAIDEVKDLIKEITILGLARLPESILKRIETIAVVCHSANIPRLEKLLRSLKGKLQLYFTKHASFSKETVIRLITRIYNISSAIEKTSSKKLLQSLIGEHKTTYTEIPPVELTAMGAGAWKSDSGYEGITYYFFNEKRKIWMTYTAMRPNYYEGRTIRLNNMYEGNCPWQMQVSMKDLSRLKFQLYNCKVNKNFRISSSEDIRGDIISKTDIHDTDFGNKLYDNWQLLINDMKDNFKYKLVQEEENNNIALLKVNSWGESSFDEVKQIFKLPMRDVNGNEINIVLKFNYDTKYLIRALERAEKKRQLGEVILGKVYRFEGRYVVDPVVMYYEGGESVSLSLD